MHRLHVVEAADEIDDRGAALDGAQSAGRIAYVGGDELRLAEAAERLQEGRGSRFALRDADARAARQQPLHDITADEAAAAATGHQLSLDILHDPCPYPDSLAARPRAPSALPVRDATARASGADAAQARIARPAPHTGPR